MRVRYVREGEPGLARARSRGVREARGHIIAFTDDGVRVDRGWLTALSIAFDSAPSVRCVTGLSLPAELETRAQVWFEQFGGLSKGFERHCVDARRARRVRRALRRWHACSWGEDLDAFLRVILTGGRLIYEPRELVWHYHRRDVRALRRQVHGSGVGLSAIFAKLLVEGPRRRDLFGRLVPGLRFLFSPKSAKNRRKAPDFPKRLTIAELARVKVGTTVTFQLNSPIEIHNMVFGPADYLQSSFKTLDLVPQGPGQPNQVWPFFFYGTDPVQAGGYTYSGTNHGNGFLVTPLLGPVGTPLPQTVKITFTKPGVFKYICGVHSEDMNGEIEVVA